MRDLRMIGADMGKDVRFELRLTAEEHAAWSAIAAADGRSLAGWVRWACSEAARLHKPRIVGTDLEDELIARAIKAFLRTGGDQPSTTSNVAEINGQPYVVLENVRGVLAYYQIVGPGKDGKFALKLDPTMTESPKRKLSR